MFDTNISDTPEIYGQIVQRSKEVGFTMPSDVYIGTLLKTLVASKPKGRFLELGTGLGLSLAWILDGMDAGSKVVSIDNDPKWVRIAQAYFEKDARLKLVCADVGKWLKTYSGEKFDLVFADAWPGKYSEIEEVLDLVKVGGFYVIDDMKAQPNWPYGHEGHVQDLVAYLERKRDFTLTKMDWSTGLVVAVRNK
ncbi:O-methyltransferase [Pseudozobellia thermophila]|nr:class I SAM-dependent methyltransferase [Pseudozobellia thermophila]